MLQLTLKDGSTVTFPFGEDSSLSVWTPDGVNGEKRGSWGEITGLALVPDAEPAPVDATPVADPATVEVDPVPAAVPASDPVASVPAEDSPPVETDPTPAVTDETSGGEPIDAVAPVTTSSPDDVSLTSDATVTESQPTPTDSQPDPAHDTAVAEANDAIVQVALGTSDPDALAKALVDVEAALATYPDSPELADAKTQLTELSASAEPPAVS